MSFTSLKHRFRKPSRRGFLTVCIAVLGLVPIAHVFCRTVVLVDSLQYTGSKCRFLPVVLAFISCAWIFVRKVERIPALILVLRLITRCTQPSCRCSVAKVVRGSRSICFCGSCLVIIIVIVVSSLLSQSSPKVFKPSHLVLSIRVISRRILPSAALYAFSALGILILQRKLWRGFEVALDQ